MPARSTRRPGIDRPHEATCVHCGGWFNWYGKWSEGGKHTKAGFVCNVCAKAEAGRGRAWRAKLRQVRGY